MEEQTRIADRFDFLAIDAGLLYGDGPQWLHDQRRESRVQVMAYLFARKDREMSAWSAAPMTVADALSLLAQVLGKDQKEAGDEMEAMLASVFDR